MGTWTPGPGPTSGDDTFIGDASNETEAGGAGNDALSGADGDDILFGEHAFGTSEFSLSITGNDILHGGFGDDILFGGIGDDALIGGDGNDRLFNGVGFATTGYLEFATFAHHTGNDTIDGGAGTDTAYLVYSNRTSGIVFTFAGASAASAIVVGGATQGSITNVEAIEFYAGAGNDQIDASGALFAWIEGMDGDDALGGTGSGDFLFGGGGDDSLSGGDGDDLMEGGVGADVIDGGTGANIVSYDRSNAGVMVDLAANLVSGGDAEGDTLLGNFSDVYGSRLNNNTLYGSSASNSISGGRANDYVEGRDGDDKISDGGGGIDLLVGGTGNDVYNLSTAASTIVELEMEGRDWVQFGLFNSTNISYILPSNVEDVTYYGTGIFTGRGNALSNVITGSAGQDVLGFGGVAGGADQLVGLGGNDTLALDSDDTGIGGLGDDDYRVFGVGATITELADEGIDRVEVLTGNTYTLGANLEILVFSGAGAFAGTGNELANQLVIGVNGASHALRGEGGDDELFGANGDDALIGGEGADRHFGGLGADTALYNDSDAGVTVNLQTNSALGAHAEGDTFSSIENLAGSSFNDTLSGDANANTLSGGAGADTINGLDGNDTLYGHSAGASSAINVSLVSSGIAAPVAAAAAPGDAGFLYVLEKNSGIVWRVNTTDGSRTQFLDIPNTEFLNDGERGALGLAFHPDYATNGRFFVYLTDAQGDIQIREYSRSANPAVANTTSTLVIEVPKQTGFSNHNGGWLGFSPSDGYLYFGTGDGGSGGDPGNNAQNLNVLLGKIIRIDVNSDAFPGDATRNYAIPATNPFVGVAGADEIWAYGVRNPWRMAFDPRNGDLYIADVGQNAREEVNYRAAGATAGANFGWRIMEGTLPFNVAPPPAPQPGDPSLVLPIFEYGRALGASITGGEVYVGPQTGFVGQYVFADFVSGRIFSLSVSGGATADAIERTAQLVSTSTLPSSIVDFATDASGALYAIGIGGSIWRLTPAAGAEDIGDTLNGGNGDDFLNGGAGADALDGGAGVDTADYSTSQLGVIVSLASGTGQGGEAHGDTLTGIENLNGGFANDALIGNSAANVLNGGAGVDYMAGGVGDDTYYIDAGGDNAVELSGEGNDTIYASVSYAMTLHVETMYITGAVPYGVGNALANTIFGNAAANELQGLDGDDILYGAAGIDLLYGQNNNDTLYGEADNDALIGDGGNDILDGGAAQDYMAGGVGDDTYYVDSLGDNPIELSGQGNDIIYAATSYAMTLNVETMYLTGTAPYGVGNAQNNIIYGNAGFNELQGLAGDDTLYGGDDFDLLYGQADNDTLYGQNGNDALIGDAGNDILDGGTGTDYLLGGAGDDSYYVDDLGDNPIESAGGGADTIFASTSYTMTANVETMVLVGGALNGNGNGENNAIIGNALTNELRGFGGDDRLTGGAGTDFLYGGTGADTFLYTSASDAAPSTIDAIMDFEIGIDKIDLTAIRTGASDSIFFTTSGGNTFLNVDLGGNGSTDLRINIFQVTGVTAGDLIWGP